MAPRGEANRPDPEWLRDTPLAGVLLSLEHHPEALDGLVSRGEPIGVGIVEFLGLMEHCNQQ